MGQCKPGMYLVYNVSDLNLDIFDCKQALKDGYGDVGDFMAGFYTVRKSLRVRQPYFWANLLFFRAGGNGSASLVLFDSLFKRYLQSRNFSCGLSDY